MMVADTDVLIDFLEGRAPVAERIALELERGELRTTAVTRFELLAGAKTARQQRVVGELVAGLPCLSLDESGADAAAEIRRALEREGVPIGMADSLIAGIVVAHNGILLTRNPPALRARAGAGFGRIRGGRARLTRTRSSAGQPSVACS